MLTKPEFQSFISGEKTVSEFNLTDIEGAISEFPYSANFHIMKALALHEAQSDEFQKALEHAAAHTISRQRLKFLVEGPLQLDFEWLNKSTEIPESGSEDELDEEISTQVVDEEPLEEIFDSIQEEESENPSEVELEVKQEEHPVLISVPPPKNEFGFSFVKVSKGKSEKKKGETPQQPFDISILATKKPIRPKRNPDVIEKFLEATPSISSPRIDFGAGSPQPDLAASSASLSEEIVTENMAMIYLKQRNFQKALDIYRKLELKYPEKSAYFAALIKNLESPIV